jgi:hypothetical protein
MSAKSSHQAAQRAIVRMLFDPRFAEAARQDPEGALGELEPALRAQLAAIDPRAFQLDRLRRRRALRTLSDEFKGTTTLALAETRSLAALEQFFASTAFHRAVAERGSMPLAFAEWLAEAIAEGRLTSPLLPDVLAIEATLARARRALASSEAAPPPGQLALAPGVFPLEVAAGALAALQQAERYLFEVGLMPAVALCDDAPALELDARTADRARLHLVTVPDGAAAQLVPIGAETHHVLRAFDGRARREADVLAECEARGLARARAREVIDGLADEAIVVRGVRG